MRLLNVNTLTVEDFNGSPENIPVYAVLCHTWQNGQEISFQEMTTTPDTDKSGYMKILNCCQQAVYDGLHYYWIDTCRVDKSSGAELSEAINSMYKWYR
jgi:hypothetical protein